MCKTINELCIGLSDVRYRPRIDAPFRGGDALLLSRAQMTCSTLVSHFSKVATDHCVEVRALPIVNPGRCLKNDKASWDALCCTRHWPIFMDGRGRILRPLPPPIEKRLLESSPWEDPIWIIYESRCCLHSMISSTPRSPCPHISGSHDGAWMLLCPTLAPRRSVCVMPERNLCLAPGDLARVLRTTVVAAECMRG